MATANQGRDVRISNKAVGLLDCFVSELDDVIYELAETIARKRQAANSTEPLRIDVDDVRQAAEMFLTIAKASINESNSDALQAIEGMYECLKTKCQEISQSE